MNDDLTKEIEGYQKWIDKTKWSSFFGKILSDMSKEELLGVIGWMNEDHKKDMANKEREHKFQLDIEKRPRLSSFPVIPFICIIVIIGLACL